MGLSWGKLAGPSCVGKKKTTGSMTEYLSHKGGGGSSLRVRKREPTSILYYAKKKKGGRPWPKRRWKSPDRRRGREKRERKRISTLRSSEAPLCILVQKRRRMRSLEKAISGKKKDRGEGGKKRATTRQLEKRRGESSLFL